MAPDTLARTLKMTHTLTDWQEPRNGIDHLLIFSDEGFFWLPLACHGCGLNAQGISNGRALEDAPIHGGWTGPRRLHEFVITGVRSCLARRAQCTT